MGSRFRFEPDLRVGPSFSGRFGAGFEPLLGGPFTTLV